MTDPQRPEPSKTLPRTVAEIIQKHVTLEVEGIDRMYLNVYVPQLQCDRGVVAFFRYHRGRHSVYVNRRARKASAVPRHRELNAFLARKICGDLEIPEP